MFVYVYIYVCVCLCVYVYFPTRIPDCDSHSSVILDLFISSSTMAFPPFGNSDHVVVSVSINFPTNSQQDALFHRIAYDYSRADWDGFRDHLTDVPWEDIFMMFISLTENIRSSLTYLHGFQLLVLLP